MVCEHCNQEMLSHIGCTVKQFDGEPPRIPYGSERWDWPAGPCHDCGAPKGTMHHPGCDVEECPVCHGQTISCGCAAAAKQQGLEQFLNEWRLSHRR